VTDNLSGLIWLKHAYCLGYQNWGTALTAANELESGSCGLTDGSSAGDWRLPNLREMQSLVDYGQYNPAVPIGHPSPYIIPTDYWTSTTPGVYSSHAWSVSLEDGSLSDRLNSTIPGTPGAFRALVRASPALSRPRRHRVEEWLCQHTDASAVDFGEDQCRRRTPPALPRNRPSNG
jgi:hypothetical protein